MRWTPRLCILLLWVAPAVAGPGDAGRSGTASEPAGAVTEIRLGLAPSTSVQEQIDAVEAFLASRQGDAGARSRTVPGPRLHADPDRDGDGQLGPSGASLNAFDFSEASIESLAPGGFRASAYLIFADPDGQIVESRDVALTFERAGSAYRCVEIRPTSVLEWRHETVRAGAALRDAERELDAAFRELKAWTRASAGRASFSVSDVERRADGSLVVQCLRFQARPGRRGYEVHPVSLVVRRSGDSLRVESN